MHKYAMMSVISLTCLLSLGCSTTSSQTNTRVDVSQCDSATPSISNLAAQLNVAVQGIVDDAGADLLLVESATASSSTLYNSYFRYYACVMRVLDRSGSSDAQVVSMQNSLNSFFSRLNIVTVSDEPTQAKLQEIDTLYNEFVGTVVEQADRPRFQSLAGLVESSFPEQPVDTTLTAANLRATVTVSKTDAATVCAGTKQELAQPVNGATLIALSALHPSFKSALSGTHSPYTFLAEHAVLISNIAQDYAKNIDPAELSFDDCSS